MGATDFGGTVRTLWKILRRMNTHVPVRKLVIATRNRGKLREFRRLFDDLPYEVLSLGDVGIEAEVEETGSTFEENAILKARAYAVMSGELTLADDSGLEVDALDGAPGVKSARYSGQGDGANNRLLLRNLREVEGESRTARYRVVLALADPDAAGGSSASLATPATPITVEGVCEGVIANAVAGDRGFGYDPLFFVPSYGRTMAQLSADEKDSISHRGVAARAMASILREMAGGGA
jgi:XTP/dITP diphosphohydrolase